MSASFGEERFRLQRVGPDASGAKMSGRHLRPGLQRAKSHRDFAEFDRRRLGHLDRDGLRFLRQEHLGEISRHQQADHDDRHQGDRRRRQTLHDRNSRHVDDGMTRQADRLPDGRAVLVFVIRGRGIRALSGASAQPRFSATSRRAQFDGIATGFAAEATDAAGRFGLSGWPAGSTFSRHSRRRASEMTLPPPG